MSASCFGPIISWESAQKRVCDWTFGDTETILVCVGNGTMIFQSCSQPSHVPNTNRVPSPVMHQTQIVFLSRSRTEHKLCSQPSHAPNTNRVSSPVMYRTQIVFLAQSCAEHKSCSQPSHVPNTNRVPSPVMYRTQIVFLARSCTEHNVPLPGYEVVLFQKAVHSYLPNPFLLNGVWGRRFVKY